MGEPLFWTSLKFKLLCFTIGVNDAEAEGGWVCCCNDQVANWIGWLGKIVGFGRQKNEKRNACLTVQKFSNHAKVGGCRGNLCGVVLACFDFVYTLFYPFVVIFGVFRVFGC